MHDIQAVEEEEYGFDNTKPAFCRRKTLHIFFNYSALGNVTIVYEGQICVLVSKVYVRINRISEIAGVKLDILIIEFYFPRINSIRCTR